MGEAQRRTLGALGSKRRVSDPFYSSSAFVSCSHRFSFLSWESGEVSSPPTGSRVHAQQGCNRGSSKFVPRFLQQTILSSESLGGMEASLGRFATKQLRCENEVFHGDHSVSPGFHSTGRLDGLHGHERCVLSYSHSSDLQEVPKIHFQREKLPIQGPMLRPDNCPTGLYQGP